MSVKLRQMLLYEILNPINEESFQRKTIISERYDSRCPTFMFGIYSSLIMYQQFIKTKVKSLSGIGKTSRFLLSCFGSLVYSLPKSFELFQADQSFDWWEVFQLSIVQTKLDIYCLFHQHIDKLWKFQGMDITQTNIHVYGTCLWSTQIPDGPPFPTPSS